MKKVMMLSVMMIVANNFERKATIASYDKMYFNW